jgi:hypothetical protein
MDQFLRQVRHTYLTAQTQKREADQTASLPINILKTNYFSSFLAARMVASYMIGVPIMMEA